CDNGGEFKNQEMNEFFTKKGIRREFSNARTPQQNGVTERRNRTLIEAARTMLADVKLPDTFWAEAVNTAYYVQNKWDLSKVPSADQVEPAVSLTVKSDILTVSSPVPTVCLDISPESSSGSRLISKGVFSQTETPSLGNALTLSNRFKDTFGDTTNAVSLNEVKANLSNMHTKPKKIFDALKDPSWVEAMQEELLQFKIQNVWILVDCPKGEGINYKEVFAPVARIEAIRLFLAYALFMGFIVYQMDVKSAFLYGIIDEELCREFEALMHDKFQMSAMGELTFFLGLQVLQKKDGIFLSQDKYVSDILKKFRYSDVRSANTPMDKENSWGKDRPDSDYGGATQDKKSTTGGCQFLGRRLISWQCKKQTIVATSTTEAEYVAAASGCGQVLWIQNQMLDYGYLKGKSHLGLWYPKDSSFNLLAYLDSDYTGAILDRKSTT
nr:copia protein [Tanacetum cinerariifolium]